MILYGCAVVQTTVDMRHSFSLQPQCRDYQKANLPLLPFLLALLVLLAQFSNAQMVHIIWILSYGFLASE